MRNILIILIICCFNPWTNLNASNFLNGSSISMKYGIYIKRIIPDFQKQTFTADFYWWILFENDSLKTKISNEEIMNIEYVNAVDASSTLLDEIFLNDELGDNLMYYQGYHSGDFYFESDFTDYPFDLQNLSIIIEHTMLETNELKIFPDFMSYRLAEQNKHFYGLSEEVARDKLMDFTIIKSTIKADVSPYNSDFGDPDNESITRYGNVSTSVYIGRRLVASITKLIIPLAIILLLVYFSFYIDPNEFEVSAALIVTSLLSSFAYRLALESDLPDVGYIIRLDKFFFTCYFLIVIAMGVVLLHYREHKSEFKRKVRYGKIINSIFKVAFPILFIGSFTFFMLE